MYSGASETDDGGYVVEHGQCVSNGQWSGQEACQSSTWRELEAVLHVLQSVAAKLITHANIGLLITRMLPV